MIKAVVFDLDNTLIDFWKMKLNSCDAAITAMKKAGLKMEKKDAMKLLFDLYEEVGIEYERIFQIFLNKADKKIDYKILSSGIVAYRMMRAGYLSTYPNVVPVLKKLRQKKLKLAILSDAPKLQAWIRIIELGLDPFFDESNVVCFEDTKMRKPDKLPFLAILKKLNVKPEEAIMVGDNMKRDIFGANAVGMKTALARYGATKRLPKHSIAETALARYGVTKRLPKHSLANYEIDNISELVRIVKE